MSDEPALHERVRAALPAWSIPHRVLACDPEAADTAAFCARYGYPPETSLNTIVVAGKLEPRDLLRIPGLQFVSALTLPR